MSTTLIPGALTTLDAVKDALGLGALTAAEAGRLRRSVNAASESIGRFCERSFARATETVRLPALSGPRIVLARTPLISITSIGVGSEVSPPPLTSTDYLIEDAAAGIVFCRFALPSIGFRRPGISQDPQPGLENPDLVVTYVGGYITPEQADVGGAFAGEPVTLPADLEEAAIRLAAHLFRTPIGFVAGEISSERLGDAAVTYRGSPGAAHIPGPIRDMLEPFRNVIVVA